ncbi:hypothetical protein MVEN_02498800 [Mycena venus]|uniref:Uncharacterized protein n=1 Tax=Mycena venus TaxID=2733690 RepID=A0A8H6WXQ1_9AGAR|nr:hypothetical protein MVEN_02498800 [Mycena venus]
MSSPGAVDKQMIVTCEPHKKVGYTNSNTSSGNTSLSTMQSVLLLAALVLGAAAHDLTINTPTIGGVAGAAECQPLLLGWSGGTPPYIIVSLAFISVAFRAGTDSSRRTVDTQPPGAAHVAEFDGQTGTSVTWTNVNATVGTQLLLTIKDNTGLSKTSAVFPVTTGSGDDCLSKY